MDVGVPDMDRVTRARIDSLLYEVRKFPERAPWGVDELARRYSLDPMIVRGLLESEGVPTGTDPSDAPDPNQQTMVMNVDEIEAPG